MIFQIDRSIFQDIGNIPISEIIELVAHIYRAVEV